MFFLASLISLDTGLLLGSHSQNSTSTKRKHHHRTEIFNTPPRLQTPRKPKQRQQHETHRQPETPSEDCSPRPTDRTTAAATISRPQEITRGHTQTTLEIKKKIITNSEKINPIGEPRPVKTSQKCSTGTNINAQSAMMEKLSA